LPLLVVACDRKPAEPASVASAAPVVTTAKPAVVRVTDASLTCMVNDMYMGTPQIPIAVQGKTYFGCCDMCKKRLAEEASVRSARDPISGRTVDKAVAVIGKTRTGKLVYFENPENFARFAHENRALLQ
jgi:YHS domain-containing protein